MQFLFHRYVTRFPSNDTVCIYFSQNITVLGSNVINRSISIAIYHQLRAFDEKERVMRRDKSITREGPGAIDAGR